MAPAAALAAFSARVSSDSRSSCASTSRTRADGAPYASSASSSCGTVAGPSEGFRSDSVRTASRSLASFAWKGQIASAHACRAISSAADARWVRASQRRKERASASISCRARESWPVRKPSSSVPASCCCRVPSGREARAEPRVTTTRVSACSEGASDARSSAGGLSSKSSAGKSASGRKPSENRPCTRSCTRAESSAVTERSNSSERPGSKSSLCRGASRGSGAESSASCAPLPLGRLGSGGKRSERLHA
mmetsp:Transcript_13883/g.44488  ORF Transcript_13883/g.44488 Transcript_13883/m.44488 type:complete len:251 (-) Transcript_13883:403-1155(-)